MNVTTMIDLLLISQLIGANPETQKFCAHIVTDVMITEEWHKFQSCLQFFERRQRRTETPGMLSDEEFDYTPGIKI